MRIQLQQRLDGALCGRQRGGERLNGCVEEQEANYAV